MAGSVKRRGSTSRPTHWNDERYVLVGRPDTNGTDLLIGEFK
jgi:hypothetical protein